MAVKGRKDAGVPDEGRAICAAHLRAAAGVPSAKPTWWLEDNAKHEECQRNAKDAAVKTGCAQRAEEARQLEGVCGRVQAAGPSFVCCGRSHSTTLCSCCAGNSARSHCNLFHR